MLLLLMACTGSSPLSVGAEAISRAEAGPSFAFARQDPTELTVPDSVRPSGEPSGERLPIVGPYVLVRTAEGVTTWEAPLPIRPRNLFFSSAGDIKVRQGDDVIKFSNSRNAGADTWAFTRDTVQIRRAKADGPPETGDYTLSSKLGRTREDSLNWATWSAANPDGTTAEFARRSLQVGEETRTGLLLPSPSHARYDAVQVPPAGTLQLQASVLPPEARALAESDGAKVKIVVELGDGTTHEVLERTVTEGTWDTLRVDLSEWAGKSVTVHFHTSGGGDDVLDYVFLGDPTLYSAVQDPQRVVLVFLDTLRYDHLGTYGYARDTSPRLDAWAEDAVVFEQARSVAPWTLPSTRAALSGQQPEFWTSSSGERLPEVVGESGWATGAFVGNVYLSSNFDMAGGWSEQSTENWPVAETQVDKAEAFLDRYPDRDAMVLLHTMDMHLPYTEPVRYQRKWASSPPGDLRLGSTRTPILKAARKDQAAVQQWVIDRYDQNIRYTDDQLAGLFERLGDDATIVIFADHGEEFWDHGGFEHGHTLHEELLRVPLIIKSPGVEGRRVEEPVSLLDLAPTVLALLGLDTPAAVTGRSLVPLFTGDAELAAELAARPLSVGRPLYGDERWGVITQGRKWTSYRGIEAVFDLLADADEANDLRASSDLDALHQSFGAGLQTQAPVAWRVDFGKAGSTPKTAVVVEISHPAGFAHAWLGQDPLKTANMTIAGPDDAGRVVVTFKPGKKGRRELYLVPNGDVTAVTGLKLRTPEGEPLEAAEDGPMPQGKGEPVLRGKVGGRSVRVVYAVGPVPLAGQEGLNATDSELASALEALGYSERNDEDEDAPEETP